MSLETISSSPEETALFAGEVLSFLEPDVVALRGELGAGKTTFAQALLSGLGATGPFVSPTFLVMKQYDLPESVRGISRVYHIDAYRVDSTDMEELGWVDLIADPGALILVEWPERIESLLPTSRTEISFTHESETERRILVRNVE